MELMQLEILKKDIQDIKGKLIFMLSKGDKRQMRDIKALLKGKISTLKIIQEAEEITKFK